MKKLALIIGLLFSVFTMQAQFRSLKSIPDRSPKAFSMQTVGITEIAVGYYSPAAKGRKVFGGMVPYNEGKPFPWRAGANENTTISFSDDVLVEGEPLKAGKYGIHIIPAESEWIIIFSNNSSSFGNAGSFHMYDPKEDALRIKATPEKHAFQETLSYDFINRTDSTVQVALRWEETSVPFTIAIDVENVVLKRMEEELRGTAGLAWEGWNAAAVYCLERKLYEKGLEFVNRSIAGGWDAQPTFTNLSTKAELLLALDRKDEAKEVITDAEKYVVATDNWDVLHLALTANHYKLPAICERMLEENKKHHGDYWGAHYGMAVYYNRIDKSKKALEAMNNALATCDDERTKQWLKTQNEKVKSGQQI